MSTDPATFVVGVPVKISEKFRPPRRITLPASCQHTINPDLLTEDYNFAVEKTTLKWLNERGLRLEKDEKERRARIEEYDRLKAEKKAKEEEERQRAIQEEEERQKALREEQERKQLEEEEEKKLQEEAKEREEAQKEQSEDECRENAEEDADGASKNEPVGEQSNDPQPLSPNDGRDVEVDPKTQAQTAVLHSSETPQSSNNTFPGNDTYYNANTPYRTDPKEVYPDMLKPTPFPSQKDSHRSPLKTPADINFADFEGDANDPFDSAALKSINDLEELAKVLDSSNINSPPQNTSTSSKDSVPNMYPNGQTNYNAFSQYPYYVQHQQQQNYGQFGSHLSKNTQVTSASPTVPSYTNTSQYGAGLNRAYPNAYYNQQWNNGFNVGSPNKPPQFSGYEYHLQSNNIAKTSDGMSPGSTSASITTATSTIPVASVNSLSTGTAEGCNPAKRQDLEDFYSKYYSQNKSTMPVTPQSGMRSGESTPSHSSGSGAAGSTNGSLRSCRSVPDLTAAADSEVTSYSNRIQTQNEGRGYSHTPPPRPSSSGLEDWKPLPDLSSSPETSPGQQNAPHGPLPHTPGPPYTPIKSRLPDPFTELTTDAQNLVQSMAEMGFPRPRVARAVQKLGTDHKKLIEVLLVLQSLQDTGEDEYKAELAFYYYMGDVQKTRDHLSAAKQLLDLGFEEDRIVDALLKHNNDRDKALEELIA